MITPWLMETVDEKCQVYHFNVWETVDTMNGGHSY